MKFHPNEYVGSIIKELGPWAMVPFSGGTPF